MCHQSVGLIARHLEAAGIPTLGFTSAPSITLRSGQPRAVGVDLPLGHTTGTPHDRAGQRELLLAGLRAGHAIGRPGTVVNLPFRYRDDHWKADPLGWSRRRQNEGSTGERSGDTRTPRSPERHYQSDDDRAAAERASWAEQCAVCLGLPDVEPGDQPPR